MSDEKASEQAIQPSVKIGQIRLYHNGSGDNRLGQINHSMLRNCRSKWRWHAQGALSVWKHCIRG
jgi:hypothetical protein